MKTIYKIKINNWLEYNSVHKKQYKKSLIPNNFTSDAKLKIMPVSHRWLWLALILTCGDHGRDTVEYTERQLRDMLESSKSIQSVLDQFVQFQLLTYEKIALIEENRIEVNVIEKGKLIVDESLKKIEDEIKTTPTKNFQNQFSQEAQKVLEFIRSQKILSDLKIFVPGIIQRFETYDNFMMFYDGILQAKGFKKIDEADKVSRKKYLVSALRSEIELTKVKHEPRTSV